MKAVTYDRYGPPEVLQNVELPEPSLGAHDILVDVVAFSVTTADWRFRASAYPPGLWVIGRLITGLFRPRHRLTSREFSGRVVAVGAKVQRFAVGDDVFGISDAGVSAERIAVAESSLVLKKPDFITHAEAAALPFGGLTGVEFVRDYARVERGHRVLIFGASGGVGAYLVQMAHHLGAEVTAVAGPRNLDFVRGLGANRVLDYTVDDPRRDSVTYDAIIDPVGRSTFSDYRAALTASGRHVFIEAGLREMWQAIVSPWRSGPQVVFSVSKESQQAIQTLLDLVEAGAIRPVVGHRFSLADTVDAHRLVDRRTNKRGAVIVEVRPEPTAVNDADPGVRAPEPSAIAR